MLDVRPGDLVLHYAKGVRAISVGATAAIDAHRPGDLPEDMGDHDGRMIRTTYSEAANAVALDELLLDERLSEPQAGPFDRAGKVKQGYLFPLSKTFGESFTATFRDRFPASVVAAGSYVPSEARLEATELLRALMGVPLLTAKGRTNKIVAVQPPDVVVATQSSPAGAPVPIAWVEKALQLLREHGSVTIHPDQVGYRSAFVGAVLLQLPYAQANGSPPVISFQAGALAEPDASPQPPTDKVATDPFTGSLEKPFAGNQRGEQPALRRRLLGSMSEAECAICGETYPSRFLWAAHIKPRSVCTDTERRDLSHVGMLACVFGCDRFSRRATSASARTARSSPASLSQSTRPSRASWPTSKDGLSAPTRKPARPTSPGITRTCSVAEVRSARRAAVQQRSTAADRAAIATTPPLG
ncbi:hypothetical protein, partial [Micromonospora aurantiaca (nom. illeg.)]